MMDRIFYRFGHFLPFYPSNNPESQNSKKMKKTPGDIIISQLCTTNDHHDTMVPEIWSFTYPLTTPKIKILRNWKKKNWIYYHFTHAYHKQKSCDVWFLRHGVSQNYLSFWVTFCPFTPLTTRKIKILKKWKKHLEISSFKWYDVWFIRYGVQGIEFFIILTHFFVLLPTNNWRYHHFTLD